MFFDSIYLSLRRELEALGMTSSFGVDAHGHRTCACRFREHEFVASIEGGRWIPTPGQSHEEATRAELDEVQRHAIEGLMLLIIHRA